MGAVHLARRRWHAQPTNLLLPLDHVTNSYVPWFANPFRLAFDPSSEPWSEASLSSLAWLLAIPEAPFCAGGARKASLWLPLPHSSREPLVRDLRALRLS